MSKKAIKVLTIISFLFVIIFITSFSYRIFADFNPEYWDPQYKTATIGADELVNIANKIIGPIRIVGSIISIVMLVVIGIRYILGSVEERAEYKKTMKPYLVGAVMMFGITNLLQIVVDIMGKINAAV